MPQDPSQMAGPTPAFMNQPQYQQQMQSLAMQVRQQEDGIKRTKKFLKAYEDIQLAQPMPMQQPQQPAFMQPPGGMAQAMNNNLPQVEESAMSFTEMAGGMGGGEMAGAEMSGGEDMGMVGEMGAEGEVGPEGQPGPAPEIGSPEDPGLSQRGNKEASSYVTQATRGTDDFLAGRQGKAKAETKAYEGYEQATKEAGVKDNEVGALKRKIQLLEIDLKKGPGTHIETDPRTGKTYPIPGIAKEDMPMMKKQLETLKEGLKKIDAAFEKIKKIRGSTPNKAMSAGLGTVMGGNLMADAHRYSKGGIDEKGNTYYPGEIANIDGVNRIRSAVEELAYYHPDNADLHPEVTDADRKKYNPKWFK